MFQSVAVPEYIKNSSTFSLSDGWYMQFVGDRSQLSEEQSVHLPHRMYFESKQFLLLNLNAYPAAWLGFVRHGRGRSVTVVQIQGKKGFTLPKDWPKLLLQHFIASLDESRIDEVRVRPARMSLWWVPRNKYFSGRMRFYYDVLPKRLGFTPAQLHEQRAFLSLGRTEQANTLAAAPTHKLKLKDYKAE